MCTPEDVVVEAGKQGTGPIVDQFFKRDEERNCMRFSSHPNHAKLVPIYLTPKKLIGLFIDISIAGYSSLPDVPPERFAEFEELGLGEEYDHANDTTHMSERWAMQRTTQHREILMKIMPAGTHILGSFSGCRRNKQIVRGVMPPRVFLFKHKDFLSGGVYTPPG